MSYTDLIGNKSDLCSTLIQALNFLKQKQSLQEGEIRFPACLLEKNATSVIPIPSRLFYSFAESVDGYHNQRKKSNLEVESLLLRDFISSKNKHLRNKHLHIIDVGGGDGVRGYHIAKMLQSFSIKIQYYCIDGSKTMIDKSCALFKSHNIPWIGYRSRFEDFANIKIKRAKDDIFLILFLDNYLNYTPQDVKNILSHSTLTVNDIIIVGTKTPDTTVDSAFLIQEFIKYSDDKMRMGVFKELGFKRNDLLDFMVFNEKNSQIEIYTAIKSTSNMVTGLLLECGDIFLSNVARRPTQKLFVSELEAFYSVRALHNKNIDRYQTIAICTKKRA